jgi:hypothetical protein
MGTNQSRANVLDLQKLCWPTNMALQSSALTTWLGSFRSQDSGVRTVPCTRGPRRNWARSHGEAPKEEQWHSEGLQVAAVLVHADIRLLSPLVSTWPMPSSDEPCLPHHGPHVLWICHLVWPFSIFAKWRVSTEFKFNWVPMEFRPSGVLESSS